MWLNQWTMFVMKKFGIVSWVLIFLFFLNRVKRNLKDDLNIFLYLKFRFYLFVFSNPFLHSVFLHFYFSKKNHKIIWNQQNTTVNFVLGFIRNCLTVMLLFKILLLMTEILLLGLINFLKKLHFFFLIFALIMHFL